VFSFQTLININVTKKITNYSFTQEKAIQSNNTMPTLHYHYVRKWPLGEQAANFSRYSDSSYSHHFSSSSNNNENGCLSMKKDINSNPALSLTSPLIQLTSVKTIDAAATTTGAASATNSPGITLDLNTQMRLRDEHERAAEDTARKNHHRKICSADGCTKFVQRGGVCFSFRHGAKVKRCSHEGCTNYAQRGGIRIRHGAKVKRCSREGCSNQLVNSGVCMKHGAKVKRRSHEGCTNYALKRGACVRHGAY
jgi:hypothetical protein